MARANRSEYVANQWLTHKLQDNRQDIKYSQAMCQHHGSLRSSKKQDVINNDNKPGKFTFLYIIAIIIIAPSIVEAVVRLFSV